jgi:hypothetical protein
MSLVPATGVSALDIGARDGFVSRLLTQRFDHVVALDLEPPAIDDARVQSVQGDATALPFADDAFDVVLCAEVLEHIAPSRLASACAEIARVTKHALVVGVPYRQDLRWGRTTCRTCGAQNPPWGHVNSFDEERLFSLFGALSPERVSHVGSSGETTNAVTTRLLHFAGNPYGTYEQEERCVNCGAKLLPPAPRTLLQRAATRAAFIALSVQRRFTAPRANWIHVRFDKIRRSVLAAGGSR